MNQNKLTFESKKLIVDYISFNIRGLIDPEPIANYLSEFGFNSNFISYDWTQGWQEKKIFYISKNQHKVSSHQFDYNQQIKSF